MKIWFVDTEMVEDSCAWSTKKKAIDYLKEECKEYGWTWTIMYNGDEENTESYVSYLISKSNNIKFQVFIYPICFDEKPCLDDI